MPGCEKCWAEAGRIAYVTQGDKVEIYHRLLDQRAERPCYLDCPEGHPDHYSYDGCPACGYRYHDEAGVDDD